MSEQRHWLDLRHGHVESSDDASPATEHSYYEARPERYAEVKVVPLDAIGPLPEVEVDGPHYVRSGSWSWDADGSDAPTFDDVRAILAGALWFDARSRVDEAQVRRIQQAHEDADSVYVDTEAARRLYLAGVRVTSDE